MFGGVACFWNLMLSIEKTANNCLLSYELSMEPFNWRSAENSGLVQISCPDIQKGFSACYFNVSVRALIVNSFNKCYMTHSK